MRAIIDTGVLISALIRKHSTPGSILLALRNRKFTAVYSTEMLVELIDVLGRPKFRDKYQIQPSDISVVVNLIRLTGELVVPTQNISACRDPKDDKFLEAALAGNASCIVSGDKDLLVLHPFEGVSILKPAEFLAGL